MDGISAEKTFKDGVGFYFASFTVGKGNCCPKILSCFLRPLRTALYVTFSDTEAQTSF